MSKTSDYSPSHGNFICTDYLFLKPKEAGLFDLVRLLRSKDKHKYGFIESTQELEQELRNFWYRWIILISILLQKLLQFLRIPMALAGLVIEYSVNLVYNNGGFLKLLIHIITGKVVWPKTSSEKYRSIIGYLDTRIDLDPTISKDDPRYLPALSCMAAKSSYENPAFIKSVVEQHWMMEQSGPYVFYNLFQDKWSTHGFMLRNITVEGTDLTVVAFCGTKPFDANDWCTDIDISWVRIKGMGRAHAGFQKALGLQKVGGSVGWPKEIDMSSRKHIYAYYEVREVLRQICRQSNYAKFIVTGHSLGGALAILFASVLMLHEEYEVLDRIEGIYTFGQPRVGDEEFGEFMKKNLKAYNVRYCRYVYCSDIVPRLPYDNKTLLFKHFAPCLFYNSCYKGKQLPEEPNKNYFSLLWAIPMYVNACWELLRGFILPYWKWGPDYKEEWCEKAFRVFGLLIPGLSAHGPQDYDNVTRLGRMHTALPQRPRKKLN